MARKSPFNVETIDVDHRAYVLNDGIYYEILYCFAETTSQRDYIVWEGVNLAKLNHARVLVEFFSLPSAVDTADTVRASHYGFDASAHGLVPFNRVKDPKSGALLKRETLQQIAELVHLNKSIFHPTYSRSDYKGDVQKKAWNADLLNMVHPHCIGFIEYIISGENGRRFTVQIEKWKRLLGWLKSGKTILLSQNVGYAPYVFLGEALKDNRYGLVPALASTDMPDPLEIQLHLQTGAVGNCATSILVGPTIDEGSRLLELRKCAAQEVSDEEFKALLDLVPDVPPVPGDELPEDLRERFLRPRD